MIEIIIEHIEMPKLDLRRFQKDFKNNKWIVTDTQEDKIIFKGGFEDASLRCHNLNKKFYREVNEK